MAEAKDGVVASCHAVTTTSGEGKSRRTHQQILSTAWKWTKEIVASDSETEVDSETDEGVEEEVEKIPKLTQETLKEMTVKELREICHKWGVRSGGNKQNLVQHLLDRVVVVHKKFSEVQEVEHTLQASPFIDPAPIHDFYLQHFNLVDMADKEWQTTEEHHHHKHWEFKLLVTSLRFATLNSSSVAKKNKWWTFSLLPQNTCFPTEKQLTSSPLHC